MLSLQKLPIARNKGGKTKTKESVVDGKRWTRWRRGTQDYADMKDDIVGVAIELGYTIKSSERVKS